ncbi:cob(I)yrinic acid a,c-diamide adenosyltransferase [Thermosyntropha lipolytica DSM 11003]|uniref:Cob(I)yrinic acid a,c-diamide adenosyltransferase n=1 Tax=Thermosyntropha lipolytica DSM 11003 TaxID=1123382 RepID=A0A1M5Q8W9_9FIRM|nr:cob(I)yrinic acid a,c-diamide adenosyltransferase [Thermosyntropha lipolytica]SHH10316.1 cob(I)yrinic acid a,c-diamide adenosyltransferase [Thermosyntropha lipolytica DSM 11003]
MILVFTGDGKGKTTSAAGLALRAWGQGKRVLLVSFLKSGLKSGEFKAIKKINSEDFLAVCFGRDCPYGDEDCCPGSLECIVLPSNIKDGDYEIIKEGLIFVEEQIKKAFWDIVILDELINVYNLFPLYRPNILALLQNTLVDIVVTGRECPAEIVELAHLVSQIKFIKNPYDKKIEAKRGIEY